MKVKEIFDLSIKKGIENDFRTKKEINEFLKRKKDNFEELPKDERQYFDKKELVNPYADSAIHHDNKKEIKKVLAGIDVTIGGLLLAKELGIDLIINHHPIGKALSKLDDVMSLQVDAYEKFGVPVTIAEKLTHKRISEVSRGINPANHYSIVDAAKLLNINLINIHTPADNCVAQLITKAVQSAKPRYVKDIIKTLMKIPEYQEAKRRTVGPVLFAGTPQSRCGKIVVSEMTGGTEGSKEIYQAMANVGIGTIIGMHQSENHRKSAEKANINVVVAGHISSDSIGMNIVLDELEKRNIEIIPFGGLTRFSRNK